MKRILSLLLCVSLSLLLVACGGNNYGNGMKRSPAVKGRQNAPLNGIQSNYQFGVTPIYLRGVIGGENHWDSGYESYQFNYVSDKTYEFCLKNVNLNAGDEFKIAAASYSDFEYSVGKLTQYTRDQVYFGSATDPWTDNSNIKCFISGNYDIYCRYRNNDDQYCKVEIALSASSILSMTKDNNFTRSTQINLTSSGYDYLVANGSYFGQFYTTRTTLFTNNALYMHNSTAAVNSGYFTPKGTNEMWHYTIDGGYENLNLGNSNVNNLRKDSSTVNTNDWYINGKYFAAHSNEIAELMEYDFNNHNYYSDDSSLFHDFMFFTAPVFTNGKDFSGNNVVTFTGVGLKDLKGSVAYYLYANGCELLDAGANTVFSQAILSEIGTTSIPVLAGMVEEETY